MQSSHGGQDVKQTVKRGWVFLRGETNEELYFDDDQNGHKVKYEQ